jgi:hypothetical protein
MLSAIDNMIKANQNTEQCPPPPQKKEVERVSYYTY